MGGCKGSHNKPIGCGASGTYAPGPEEGENEKEEEEEEEELDAQFLL